MDEIKMDGKCGKYESWFKIAMWKESNMTCIAMSNFILFLISQKQYLAETEKIETENMLPL